MISSKGISFCFVQSRSYSTPKVALVLSGCGVYDGAEILESSSCMIHLSRHKTDLSVFAPNIIQRHVINHTSGQQMDQARNVLEESARIARGNIASLDKLSVSKFDALIIPGGFGAAKNLSSFAFDGIDYTLNQDLEKCLRDFLSNRKPIGMCCIAPILLARILPGAELTMGGETEDGGKWPYTDAVATVKKLGVHHVQKQSKEIHVDQKNLIVTSPAYMCDKASLFEIFSGIGLMIDAVLGMVADKKG